MNNNIEQELVDLGIIDIDFVKKIYPSVRDNENIHVKKCNISNVIYLSENDYIEDSRYQDKHFIDYWGGGSRQSALISTLNDDSRRFQQFTEIIKNKDYLDFGTGLGGVLDLFQKVAKSISGIELQKEIRDHLTLEGYKMYSVNVNFGYYSPDEVK